MRDRAGQNWRAGHRNWDSSAPWRRSTDWWRNDSGFGMFTGLRAGFFFIPELGYRQPPPAYQHREWRAGERLPRWFWQYSVRNYYRYGLPRPPDGCLWVWVDHDMALIDERDGYILDIVHNTW